MNLLYRRLGPAFQTLRKRLNQPQQKNVCVSLPLFPLFTYPISIVKHPSEPRDAAFNSSSKSSAMLDFVEGKNANPRFFDKQIPALYNRIPALYSLLIALFQYFSRRAPLFEVLLALLVEISTKFCNWVTWEDRCTTNSRKYYPEMILFLQGMYIYVFFKTTSTVLWDFFRRKWFYFHLFWSDP